MVRPIQLLIVLLLLPVLPHATRADERSCFDLRPLFLESSPVLAAYELFKEHKSCEGSEALEFVLADRPAADSERPALVYLAARMARDCGRYELERRHLNSLRDDPVLGDLAHFRLGRVAARRGQRKTATKHFQAVSEASPDYAKAQSALADELRKKRKWKAAAAALCTACTKSHGKDKERCTLKRAAVLLRLKARRDEALGLVEDLWEETRSEKTAKAAFALLASHDARPSRVSRMVRRVSRASGYNAGAMARDLRGQRKRLRSRKRRALVDYGLGVVYAQRRKTRDEALRRFRMAWRSTKSRELKGWILLDWSKALERSDDDRGARKKLEKLLRELRRHPASLGGRVRLARLLADGGETKRARKLLEKAIDEEGRLFDGADALWQLAWLLYRGGDWDTAGKRFLELEERYGTTSCCGGSARWGERARYWRARCLDRADQKDQAIAAWQQLLKERPFTYYAHLAHSRLSERRPADHDVAWSTAHVPSKVSVSLADLSQLRVRRDASLETAVTLIRLGLYDDALDDLEARLGLGELAADGLVLAGVLHVRKGELSAAHRLVRRHGHHGAWPDARSDAYWKLAYPLNFVSLAQRHGEEFGVSSHLVMGIIRHESGFRTDARSYANAVGLAQLLPNTARSISERLLQISPPTRKKLERPEVNLLVAVRYVRELLNLFKGDVALAVTAYNVGAGRVRGWLKKLDVKDGDEFVERIPYRTTAAYVRKVVSAAAAYAFLYGEPADEALRELLLPERIPSELGPYMVRDPALLGPTEL